MNTELRSVLNGRRKVGKVLGSSSLVNSFTDTLWGVQNCEKSLNIFVVKYKLTVLGAHSEFSSYPTNSYEKSRSIRNYK